MQHTGHGKFFSNTQILGVNYFSTGTQNRLLMKNK